MLRLCLPMQRMQVQSLVGELRPTCLTTRKPTPQPNKFNQDFTIKKKKKKMTLLTCITLYTKKGWEGHSESDGQQGHYGYACFLLQQNSNEHYNLDRKLKYSLLQGARAG